MRTGRDDKKREEWLVRQGPWSDEPDWAVFEEAGLNCGMRRNVGGAWCGYVFVPEWHPLSGLVGLQHGEPVWFDVHGGITWTGKRAFPPECGAPNMWSIGFDCGHSHDLSPGDYKHGFEHGEYRNFGYAESETRGLAVQVSGHGVLEQMCRIVSGPNNGGEE